MTKSKKIFFVLTLVAIMVSLSACNFDLGELFNKMVIDHEFSDDGIAETDFFFTAVKEENFQGTIGWMINVKSGEVSNDYTITASKKIVEDVDYVVFTIVKDEVTYRILEIGEDHYYINDTDMEYTETATTEFINLSSLVYIGLTKGIVKFEDSGWVLAEARLATIKNKSGVDEETKEFEYNKADSEDTMTINFKKKSFAGIAAIIERIYYETYSGSQLTETTIYFSQLPSANNTDTQFTVPTVAGGYTLLD